MTKGKYKKLKILHCGLLVHYRIYCQPEQVNTHAYVTHIFIHRKKNL